MGIYTYSPETNAKIDQLCNDVDFIIMADHPEQDIIEIDQRLQQLYRFIRDGFQELGARTFLVEISFELKTSATPFSLDLIDEETKAGNNLFVINKNFETLKVELISQLNYITISTYSKSNACVVMLVQNGIDIMLFSNGVAIQEKNLRHPSTQPTLFKKRNRPAEDYKISLMEFYKSKVRTSLTKHWHNASKRILIGGKTEEIFQMALVQWLFDNLSAKKINMKVKKISSDETDIEIIKSTGETYLLELKWLGKNVSTSYSLSRLSDAFDQVENYLESDLEVLEATLVVYDGRTLADFELLKAVEGESGNWKEVRECDAKKLSRRATALVYHLISETASKRKTA